MRLSGWVAASLVGLGAASLGCSRAGDASTGTGSNATEGASGGTAGEHGVRLADHPWVSYTAGTEDLRIVEVEFETCRLNVTSGTTGNLTTHEAVCSAGELETGRQLFSEDRVEAYLMHSLSESAENPSGERRIRIIIDFGQGGSPTSLLFPASGSEDAEVNVMLLYLADLFETYQQR